MAILGVLVIVALVGLVLWSSSVRSWIRSAGFWIGGALLWFWNQLPGVGGRVTRTARSIRNVMLVIWGITLLAFVVVGAFNGSADNGLVIGICLPLILYLMYKSSFVRWIVTAPVVLFIIWNIVSFSFGVASPSWKKEVSAWWEAKSESGKIELHKSIAQSQSHAGKEGWIGHGRELRIMTNGDTGFKDVSPGTRVLVLEFDKVPASSKGQGLTQVMFRGDNGYFLNGEAGLVPSSRIVWKPIVVVMEGGVRQLDL